ncbi:MAG: CehA/McbA family metallohydrolase [Myxococcota bacterium]
MVPDAALDLTLECFMAPPPDWAAGWVKTKALENPHTGTTQFYAAAPFEAALAPGRYRVRAYRGIGYPVEEVEFELEADEARDVELRPAPYATPWRDGWYAADDHLHITRRTEADDARIAAWMRAEGLHVANLLQMGTIDQFSVTPQRAFGPAGVVRSAGPDPASPYLLVPGQEHPRTHFLGHTITLGARAPVDRRDTYILYETTFREGRAQGGVSGYAHWGLGPAQDGLAVDAPRGLVGFVEVLQFEMPHYAVWYELLDLGFRVAPSAGTDFPCGPWSIPGRERVYAKVAGPLRPASFVEAMRAGRTYVTNGALLGDFRVGEAGVGEELALERPGEVRVRGEIRFDPARDKPTAVELVLGGEAMPLVTDQGWGTLRFDQAVPVERTTWAALRVSGDKRGEAPFEPLAFPEFAWELGARIADGAHGVRDLRQELARSRTHRPSALHTAPVWITVGGTPSVAWQDRGQQLTEAWVERLDTLSARLADEGVGDETIWDWFPYSDGVPEEHLRRHRDALRAAIAESRARLAP